MKIKRLRYHLSSSKKIGSNKFIDISTLDESDDEVFNSIYYKEIPLVTGDMDRNNNSYILSKI